MQTYTTAERNYLEQLLQERQLALQSRLAQENATQDEFVQVAGEAHDAADASFATLSIDLGHAAVARELNELRALEAARQRLTDGSFGDCVECGMQIPYERLVVQPTATRCAPCQESFEKTHVEGLGHNSI